MATATVYVENIQFTVREDAPPPAKIRAWLVDSMGNIGQIECLSAVRIDFNDIAPGPATVVLEALSADERILAVTTQQIIAAPQEGEKAPDTKTIELPVLTSRYDHTLTPAERRSGAVNQPKKSNRKKQ